VEGEEAVECSTKQRAGSVLSQALHLTCDGSAVLLIA
jgi:hypothetical protein